MNLSFTDRSGTGKLARLAVLPLLIVPLQACSVCGCSDADMQEASLIIASQAMGPGRMVQKASLHFDTHLFSDDRFSFTVTYQDPVRGVVTETAEGSYDKSFMSDQIVFRFDHGTTRIIQSGTKYTVKCEDNKGIRIKRSGAPDIVFRCRG